MVLFLADNTIAHRTIIYHIPHCEITILFHGLALVHTKTYALTHSIMVVGWANYYPAIDGDDGQREMSRDNSLSQLLIALVLTQTGHETRHC